MEHEAVFSTAYYWRQLIILLGRTAPVCHCGGHGLTNYRVENKHRNHVGGGDFISYKFSEKADRSTLK